jgi:hypothetical protein
MTQHLNPCAMVAKCGGGLTLAARRHDMRFRQKGLPFHQWPQIDRDLFGAAVCQRRRSNSRASHRWSSATVTTVFAAYRLALRWLIDKGALDARLTPAQRWTDGLLDQYVAFIEDAYAEATVLHRLSGLERAISALEPDADRNLIKLALGSLGKPKPSVVDAAGLPTTTDLLNLGLRIMLRAEQEEMLTPLWRAALFREGLQVALFACRFLRPKDFRSLIYWCPSSSHLDVRSPRMDDILTPDCSGAIYEIDGVWRLKYVASKARKTQSVSRDADLPKILFTRLTAYVKVHRPELCKGERYQGDAFWVSTHARQESAQSIYRALCKHTEQWFGSRLPPKMSRKCAATTISIFAPAEMPTISKGLGHSSLNTTTEHYVASDALSASSRINETMNEIRRAATERRRLGRRS